MSRKQRILQKRFEIFCEGDTEFDRINTVPGEYVNFMRLVEYCITQNRNGNTPHFLIVNNPDFEYVACLHSPEYNGQDIHKFILAKLGAKDIDTFKGNTEIYNFLNSNGLSNKIMLDKIRDKEKFIRNDYDVKKTTFDITIKSTDVEFDLLSRKCSNIDEFFDVIDW